MKKTFPILLCILCLLSSCRTREKVVYFQDVKNGDAIRTQVLETMKLSPGDKVSIVVSSSATPELAAQYNLPIITIQGSSTARSYNNQIALYTLDEEGNIDIPTLGRVKIGGITRSEAATKIQSMLRQNLLRDAVVTISAYDQYVTVLGEVKNPGRINISRDNITLLEAIGQCGDLTIQARRDDILVLRQEGSITKSYYVDIRSKDLLNSPVYNLQQNDVVVVRPNKVKQGQDTNNDNSVRSISTWLSVSSVLISLGILIFR